MNKILVLSIVTIATLGLLLQNSAFAQESNVIFYGKGTSDKSSPFPDKIIRTLIHKDTATIVNPTTHGIEVVRMDIQPSDVCIDTVGTFCFDGTVTEVRNTQDHKAGDKIDITLDLYERKEIVTFNSGSMAGTQISIDLSKTIIRFDEPFSIELVREGGFAVLHNAISIDLSTSEITKDGKTILLDEEMVKEISDGIKKIKFNDVAESSYQPVQGSADYFTYTIQIRQGPFYKMVSWTDTSKNVPEKLVELKDTIMDTADDVRVEPELIEAVIAKNFTMASPTFAFDGIPESLHVEDVMILESFPEQYVVTISFDSLQGGYGDRTDQILTQAITPHTIVVKVVEKKVISAIIDQTWDEINQQQLES